MFYFGSYEGLRFNEGQVAAMEVPTDAQRKGDFSGLLIGNMVNLCASSGSAAPSNMNFDSGQLFDPATEYNYTCPANPANPGAGQATILIGTPIPGNIIQNLDPVAQKILKLFPEPNTSGANNYINETPQVQNNDQFDARVDATLSQRNSVFARYMLGNSNEIFPGDNPNFDQFQHFRGHNLVGGWTLVLGPTVINDVRIGYQRNYLTYTCEGCPRPKGTLSSFGIVGLTNTLPEYDTLYPNFTFVNFPTWGDGFPGYFPVVAPDSIEHFGDTFTKVFGHHIIRAGGTLDFWQTNGVTDPRQMNGDIDFNGQYSSLAGETNGTAIAADLADMELGYPSGGDYTKNAIVTRLVGGRWIGLFVQDDIRITPQVSLQAGLRWQYDRQPMDENNQLSTIFPISKDFVSGDAFLFTALPDDQNDALCSNPYFISTTGQCVVMSSGVRRAKGLTGNKVRQLSYGPGPGYFAPRLGFSWQPMNSDKLVLHAGAGLFSNVGDTNRMGSFANNNPMSVQTPTFTSAFGAPPLLTNGIPTQTQQIFAGATATALQNVSAQMMPSASYNTPQIYEWSLSIQSQLARDWGAEIAYVGNRAIHMDFEHEFGNQPVPGVGPLQPRRPYPDFGKLDYDDYTGYSNYKSIYGRLEKRASYGLTALVSYTFSKALDDGDGNVENETRVQNDNDRRRDYGVSDYNMSQTFVASPVYELPFGRGKRFLSNGRVISALAGSWQVSGIISVHSGYPFTINSSQDYSNTQSKSPRPDRVCNGDGPKTISEWFDTSCFTTGALA